MGQNLARTVGHWRQVSFKVAPIDDVAACVDLLVVGIWERGTASSAQDGIQRLDPETRETVKRLHEGRIFNGAFGETLTLTMSPLLPEAQDILLVGLGKFGTLSAESSGELAELAMRTTRHMDIQSVGCLFGWSADGMSPGAAATLAAAMFAGPLRALDAEPYQDRAPPLDWVYFVPRPIINITYETFGRVLDAWPRNAVE